MVDVIPTLMVIQTAGLALASLLLVYPLVTHARNVAYTEGISLLSLGFFLLTASYIAGVLLDMTVVSGVLDLASATTVCIGIWFFTRSFVRTGQRAPIQKSPLPSDGGGFEHDDGR